MIGLKAGAFLADDLVGGAVGRARIMTKENTGGTRGQAADKSPGGAGATARPSRPGSPELPRGASVGRYIVLGLLGKGGMGEVYAAYDPELDRKIALKLLRAQTTAGVDPAEGRARLLREAQAIARLSDPNVVVVFDVGTFGDQVFLAMEFVDGSTVGYWVHAQPRTWREVVKTFTAAGRGLASAHRAGVVHRDFKPDNVMIGHDGKVRVMDFGLARTIDSAANGAGAERGAVGVASTGEATAGLARRTPSTPSAMAASVSSTAKILLASFRGRVSPTRTIGGVGPATPAGTRPAAEPPPRANLADDTAWTEVETATRDLSRVAPLPIEGASQFLNSPLTESGAMMGTPAYMAPEQFEGKPLDARTDQFSFCVAVYEALYGERPFDGKNIQQLTANVINGRVREAPAKAHVPKWLRRVLLRGLRVDRKLRHESMEALLAEMARDPARTGRRWMAAGAVGTLIVVLGVGLVRTQRQQRMRCQGADDKLAGIWELPTGKGLSPRKTAIRAKFMASGKRYAADSFTVVMTTLDHYVTDWNKMHRDSCEATNVRGEQSPEVLDLRMSCLNDRLSEVRALTNAFSDANGEGVTKSVEAAQAIRSIEPCADVATLRAVVKPPQDPKIKQAVAEVRTRLADVKALANLGRYKEAMLGSVRVMADARKTAYEPAIAEAVLQLAELQANTGDTVGAERSYEEAVWTGESSHHDEVVLTAASQLVWAVGYRQRRYTEGERWARYAGALLRRLGQGHDLIAGWRANNLATMYTRQGKLEEALSSAVAAVSLKQHALGEHHLDVAISHDNVAQALLKLGRPAEALERNQRSVTILRGAVGPDHPSMGSALVNAAEIQNALGRYSDAQASARRSLAILEREADASRPMVAYALYQLGGSLAKGGHPAAAVAQLERALQIREAEDPQPDLLGETRFALALALTASRQSSERALSLAEQARVDFAEVPEAQAQETEVEEWIRGRQGRLSMR